MTSVNDRWRFTGRNFAEGHGRVGQAWRSLLKDLDTDFSGEYSFDETEGLINRKVADLFDEGALSTERSGSQLGQAGVTAGGRMSMDTGMLEDEEILMGISDAYGESASDNFLADLGASTGAANEGLQMILDDYRASMGIENFNNQVEGQKVDGLEALVGGAAQGVSLGAQFGGLGAGIGGAIGALAGWFGADAQNDALEAMKKGDIRMIDDDDVRDWAGKIPDVGRSGMLKDKAFDHLREPGHRRVDSAAAAMKGNQWENIWQNQLGGKARGGVARTMTDFYDRAARNAKRGMDEGIKGTERAVRPDARAAYRSAKAGQGQAVRAGYAGVNPSQRMPTNWGTVGLNALGTGLGIWGASKKDEAPDGTVSVTEEFHRVD